VIKGQIGEAVLDRYSELRRKVFLELASPISTKTKRLVFHSDDPLHLEQDLTKAQERARVRWALREQIISVATPFLITGMRTAEVRRKAKNPDRAVIA
jgi:3-(3-hydroxy-phenyl)propionate hydroxylase/6-hydroxy-3-succinoylpyridine 3-monooxygenase